MRNRYTLSGLIASMLFLAMFFISCSENEEDIAAPSISFIQPSANDTVGLTNGYVTIKVVAQDRVNINDMEMKVTDETGSVLYSYDEDDITAESYTCIEKFYPLGISAVTKMKLCVTFKNEFKNWNTKSIVFCVRP